MYDYIKKALLSSNIGSSIKKYIIENDMIKKEADNLYYESILKILECNKIGFIKEEELLAYLRKE